jgi:hypothetical protein
MRSKPARREAAVSHVSADLIARTPHHREGHAAGSDDALILGGVDGGEIKDLVVRRRRWWRGPLSVLGAGGWARGLCEWGQSCHAAAWSACRASVTSR